MLKKKTISQCVSGDWCRGWNAAVSKMPKWISVEERLPNGGQIVLCETRYFFDVLQWDSKSNVWIGAHTLHHKEFVTHWMPLPEAPKED